MQPFIRSFRRSDLARVYDICVRTADSGADARGRHLSDRLVGDVYAAPYATREPEHTHILDDGSGSAVGYILGTADTAAFVRWYRERWVSATAHRYPNDAKGDDLLAALRRPERMLLPELADHPAQLHIDLLPEWRGRGYGRALMGVFLDGLHRAGAARVHLGVSTENSGAQAFYERLGFRELPVPDAVGVRYLGRGTAGPPGG